MLNFQTSLYDPIYLIQGTPATLTLAGGRVIEDLTVIDKTVGVVVGEHMQSQTIRPAAAIRVKELGDNGVKLADLDGARIDFNDSVWDVTAYLPKPSPRGKSDGEAYLLLERLRRVDLAAAFVDGAALAVVLTVGV